MKKSIFLDNSKFWICAFDFKQYEEFIEYQSQNKPYLTYYNVFFNNINDILFLFCRSIPKKIRGGIFGYCVLENESQVNNLNIKVFKDDLVNRCYSKIKDIKLIKDPSEFLTLEELCDTGFDNITVKSFSNKYLKKFLLMTKIPQNIGDYIIEKYDKKYMNYQKNKEQEVSDENELSEESSDETEVEESSNEFSNESSEESSNESSNEDEIESETNSTEKSTNKEEDNDDEEINKNGLIPIMIELCKKFKFPEIKYDKKKYNNFNNPDIVEKCKYFKRHIFECEKCNIINNNNNDLSYLVKDSKISFREFKYTDPELDESIDRYQMCNKFDGFGYDVDEINIKINYITDEDNIYNNCILLYITKPPK